MMMPGKSVSNPDRRTYGGKISADWSPSEQALLTLGTDYQENRHRIRRTRNEEAMPYRNQSFATDAEFSVLGLFAEWQQDLGESLKLIAGLRHDQWEAKDYRLLVAVGMMGSSANPTAGWKREESLNSGFLRLESQNDRFQSYLGIGHSERFPDYWELFSKESATSLSAFGTNPEKTTQIDAGISVALENFSIHLSAFQGWVDDFILIESAFRKATMGMNSRMATISRNVDATTLGFEATAIWSITTRWRLEGSLAWVQGENTTEDRPLAQQPPLESRLSLQYNEANWSAGALLRLVAEQDRFVINQGNIVGQDLGPTSAFETVSLFASWMPVDHLRITAGFDNVFDATFAEHLSRGGTSVSGFPPPTLRINEPGRSWWIRCGFDF
jgi:iron complex outermembrane recepter protein